MGNGEWGMGTKNNYQCPISNYQLAITHYQFPIPNSLYTIYKT
nr:hypothetical protein [Hassalia byssoidea]